MLKNNEISQCLMYIVQVHDFRHVNKYELCIFSHPDRSAESMPVFPSFLVKIGYVKRFFRCGGYFFHHTAWGFSHTGNTRSVIASVYIPNT